MESRHVHARRFRIRKFEIKLAQDFVVIAQGKKIEVAAFRIENRPTAVGKARRDRRDFPVSEGIKINRGVSVFRGLGVGHPLAVRRPGVVGEVGVFSLVN